MTNMELTGITTGLGALNFAKKLRRIKEEIDVTPNSPKKIIEHDVKDKG